MSPRVVVIGDALIDELVDDAGTTHIVGGSALNVAVGLGILGVPATLVAMIGDDIDGALIRSHLDDHGVHLLPTLTPDGTGIARSERIDGEPHYSFSDSMIARALDFDDVQRAAIADAGVVAVSGFPFDVAAQAGLLEEAVASAARGTVVAVDPNPRAGMLHDADVFRERLEAFGGTAQLLKLGDDDAQLLYGRPVGEVAPRLLSPLPVRARHRGTRRRQRAGRRRPLAARNPGHPGCRGRHDGRRRRGVRIRARRDRHPGSGRDRVVRGPQARDAHRRRDDRASGRPAAPAGVAAAAAVKSLPHRPPTAQARCMTETTPAELTGPDAIARVRELVEDIDFTMLTTRDPAGNLVSRPMSTRQMDDNGDIWFFVLDDSKKVDEAEADDEVGLAYLDSSGHRYVSVAGHARVVHDAAKMKELYSPSLDIWFEHGLETPGLALLKVTPVECEFWEPRHGKLATAAGMLKSLVTSDTPDDTMLHGQVSC